MVLLTKFQVCERPDKVSKKWLRHCLALVILGLNLSHVLREGPGKLGQARAHNNDMQIKNTPAGRAQRQTHQSYFSHCKLVRGDSKISGRFQEALRCIVNWTCDELSFATRSAVYEQFNQQ